MKGGQKWGTGLLTGHGQSTGYQHQQINQQSDKNSAHNFSTTTKSKFNTIDQYNQNNNGGSNSRGNSPVRLTQINNTAGGNASETHGAFNIKNCTIYSKE